MRTPFASLARLLLRSVYGLRPPKEILADGRRSILKALGVLALAILLIADFGAIFVALNLSMYTSLSPHGMQGLLLLNSYMTAAMMVFVLGLLTALSTYPLSPTGEDLLLALPLKPRELLSAKMLIVYLAELAFGGLLIAVSAVIFGIMEAPGLSFWIAGLLAVLAAPLLPLALVYLVLVPLMSTARFLKKRNTLLMLGGFLGIAFALAFNALTQRALSRANDPAWLYANFSGPDSILARMGSAWPPALLAWRSLTTPGLGGVALGLANLALGAGALAAAAWLLGPAYARSASAFGEADLRRLRAGEAAGWIERTSHRHGVLLSLVMREIRLMNREPMYFLNGPFIVLLTPVLLIVALAAQGGRSATWASMVNDLGGKGGAVLLAAASGAFLGCSTSIASTAVSRDAKLLPAMRALPLSGRDLMRAKLIHALLFAWFGAFVGAVGLALFLGLSVLETLAGLFISGSFSSLLNLSFLWLDTARPKFDWQNPITALKQNPNSILSIFGTMGSLGLFGWLATKLGLGVAGYTLLYGVLPAILFTALLPVYERYAERKTAGYEV